MPYKLDWLDDLVIIEFSGQVSLDELMEADNRVSGDPRFDNLKKRICNCTDITKAKFASHDLKVLAHVGRAAATSNARAHVAIITTDPAVRKNANLYKKSFGANSWQISIFDSISDAIAWAPS